MKFKWGSNNTPTTRLLRSTPKGVDKQDFNSPTKTSDFKFNATFRKPGTYHFICTIHPDNMKLSVKVRK